MAAYYNEHDAFAAGWLRELIKAKVIADGDIDERDIRQVEAADLKPFRQCHFFAGIGVWSYALRAAGWPDDTAVWTGSCPCQSFSASGKRGGFSDQRHLWPAWFRLIRESRPHTIFGEQVASKDGLAWLDVVFSDLEGAGYACGAADTCSAGFGAPHIRQRLYFCADAKTAEILTRSGEVRAGAGKDAADGSGNNGDAGQRSYAEYAGLNGQGGLASFEDCDQPQIGIPHGGAGDLRDSDLARLSARQLEELSGPRRGSEGRAIAEPSPTNGFWAGCDWWYGRDGKYRPIEPGLLPLAHGSANRVGRLRGYGNALNAEQAKAFIEAYMEINQ